MQPNLTNTCPTDGTDDTDRVRKRTGGVNVNCHELTVNHSLIVNGGTTEKCMFFPVLGCLNVISDAWRYSRSALVP